MTDSNRTRWHFAVAFISFVCFGCFAALAQNRAPSPQQCLSDVNSWYHQWSAQSTFKTDDPGPSFGELEGRIKELSDCSVSKAPKGSVSYDEMMALYWNEENERQKHFILRHGLTKQFLEEDAGGKR
jgi:hypothetical protein